MIQDDHQVLGVVGYCLALLGDCDESRKAFAIAREIKTSSPYPYLRKSQGRLAKYEVLAASACDDAERVDESLSYWTDQAKREQESGSGNSSMRDVISDIATAGVMDKALTMAHSLRETVPGVSFWTQIISFHRFVFFPFCRLDLSVHHSKFVLELFLRHLDMHSDLKKIHFQPLSRQRKLNWMHWLPSVNPIK